jgi:hypothetical protein
MSIAPSFGLPSVWVGNDAWAKVIWEINLQSTVASLVWSQIIL